MYTRGETKITEDHAREFLDQFLLVSPQMRDVAIAYETWMQSKGYATEKQNKDGEKGGESGKCR